MTDPSTDITRIQLAEPINVTRVIYKNMGGGLLAGAENDRCTTKTYPSMGEDVPENLVSTMTCRELNRWENVLSRQLSWTALSLF